MKRWWLLLINLLLLIVVGVGGVFAYRTYTYRTLNQVIEQKKSRFAPSTAYDLQAGNSGDSKVLAYFPKGKDGKRIKALEQKMYAVIDKRIGHQKVTKSLNHLYFLWFEKEETDIPKVRKERLHLLSYQIKGSKLEQKKETEEGMLLLTDDDQALSFAQLFKDTTGIKETYAKQLEEELTKIGKSDEEKRRAIDALKQIDLANIDFKYENSQFTLLFPKSLAGVDQLSLPISHFYGVINEDYLMPADKGNYETYKAEQEAKKSQKRIALTFDDGPNATTTPQVLDLLKKHKVKATFFLLGQNIAGNEEILKRMQSEGHQIANHSWSHSQLTSLSEEQIRQEINQTQETIQSIVGQAPTGYRPPYGAVNQTVQSITNLPAIYWTVDSLDWQSRNPTAILEEIKAHTQPGSIILMHDIHQTSVDSLDSVLSYLTSQGYSFATVDELIGSYANPQYVYYSQYFSGPAQ